MTLHVEEGLDLAQREILPVSLSDELVESAEQFEGVAQNLPLIQCLANARDNLCEEVQRVDVLQDVRLAVGDEDHVEFIEGLIDEADIVLLDGCVLGAAVCEFGERGEESFDSGSLHVPELARDDCLATSGAY